MKINKTTLNIFALLSATLALGACKTDNKSSNAIVSNDCSMVFESAASQMKNTKPQDRSMSAYDIESQDYVSTATECKVLPVRISAETSCEIAGSDEIDNLMKFYDRDSSNHVVILLPLEKLLSSGIMSYKNVLAYYGIKMDMKKHLDSNIFDGMKEYNYKGMKCHTSGRSFTTWIGEGKAIIAIEDKAIETKAATTLRTTEKSAVKKVKNKKVAAEKDVRKTKE